ncbi:MAG: alpha/beta hydrolase [Chloroflexi bacterium]|nr:alpha/beta hydrolase [Chloroflexota bacterium]
MNVHPIVRGVVAVVIVMGLVIVAVPLFLPAPQAGGTVPPAELADPDSRFRQVGGIQVHYKMMGQGEPVMVLLHGFGASTYSWREVMEPLSRMGTVIAFDRPAFGLTQRPMPGEWEGASPYSVEAQADLTVGLLDELGVKKAVLVGHSAGGAVATAVALRYPERVQGLVLVAPAVQSQVGLPRWVGPLLASRQLRWFGPLLMRSISQWGERMLTTAWYDPSAITEQVRASYRKPLRCENWDRALWELVVARGPLDLSAQMSEIQAPILLITGDNDRVVETEETLRLAEALPNAQLQVIANCGHLPQEERPQEFVGAVFPFLFIAALQ